MLCTILCVASLLSFPLRIKAQLWFAQMSGRKGGGRLRLWFCFLHFINGKQKMHISCPKAVFFVLFCCDMLSLVACFKGWRDRIIKVLLNILREKMFHERNKACLYLFNLTLFLSLLLPLQWILLEKKISLFLLHFF